MSKKRETVVLPAEPVTKDALLERIKELRLIYTLSELAQDPQTTLEQFLHAALTMLPSGWRYPDDVYASVTLDEEVFATENYCDTPWQLRSAILVDDAAVGDAVVGYLSPHPEAVEGPFFSEERSLLAEVARQIGRFVERIQAQEALRRNEARYRGLFEHTPIAIFEQDFSAVKQRIEQLRDEGVRDFRAFFEAQAERRRSVHLTVFACDFDSTLAEEGQVDPATWDALRAARNAGMVHILVTGRTLDSIVSRGPFRELFEAIVAENGAVVLLTRRNQVVLPFGALDSRLVQQWHSLNLPMEWGLAIAASVKPHDEVLLRSLRTSRGCATVVYNRNAVMFLPPGATKGSGLLYALDHLLLTRLGLPAEIDTVAPWLGRNGGSDEALKALPTLPRGEASLSTDLRANDAGSRPAPLRFQVGGRAIPHIRHLHKYLRTPLPETKRFYFRTREGKPLGAAASLWEFRERIADLPPDSLRYHIGRGDFVAWCSGALHDEELARRISKIAGRQLSGDTLRQVLLQTVAERYEELEILV